MNYLSEMGFGTKCDWENLVQFGSKAIECPKKLQLADWMIVDDGELNGGSLNLCGDASGSAEWHGSSAKSSISALTDSSPKDVNQTPNFRLITFEGSSENFGNKIGMKGSELYGTSSPHLEASVGSMEQLIGLKLGKRTYFENSTSLSVMPTPITTTTQKKTKLSVQKAAIIPRCQVDGCNMDLSTGKDYHRKHRVCGSHSKSQKVIIGGHERRFCQQCSRFHVLGEFDERKRSCRRRLSDHNARRRKPQHETIQFNLARLLPPIDDTWGRQKTNFLLHKTPPLVHPITYCKWDSTRNSSKFTLTKGGYPLKSYGDGFVTDERLRMPGGVVKLQQVPNMHGNAMNGLLASKSPKLEVFNPGVKGSMMISSSSHVEAAVAPACSYSSSRALSLLSNTTNSCWGGGSYGPDSIPLVHHHPIVPMLENNNYTTQEPIMTNAIPETVPLSDYFWLQQTGQHANHPYGVVQSSSSSSNIKKFEEFCVFKTPYPYQEEKEADLCYSNMC